MTIKRVVAVGVAALVLILAGLAGYLATLDVDDYRGEMLAAVEAATGREVSLEAPIRLAISLQPTLVLEGFTLGGPPGREGPALVRVKRIEGAVALLPLIAGDIEVRRLEVDGVEVHLQRYADGSGSWAAR